MLRTAVFLYILTGFVNIHKSERNISLSCKTQKHTNLYLLNNFVSGASPYDGFIPAKYGFRHSYYLAHILDYEVNNRDSRSPFVYLIINNKINNVKIKIK